MGPPGVPRTMRGLTKTDTAEALRGVRRRDTVVAKYRDDDAVSKVGMILTQSIVVRLNTSQVSAALSFSPTISRFFNAEHAPLVADYPIIPFCAIIVCFH